MHSFFVDQLVGSNYEVTGIIPSEIGQLTKLKSLDLGKSVTIVNQNLINIYISIYVIVLLESNLMIHILFVVDQLER